MSTTCALVETIYKIEKGEVICTIALTVQNRTTFVTVEISAETLVYEAAAENRDWTMEDIARKCSEEIGLPVTIPLAFALPS